MLPATRTSYATGGTPLAITASYLCVVVVTVEGSAAGTLYDSIGVASGNKLLVIPADAAVGSTYALYVPVANDIYFDGLENGPSLTIGYR
jgi:hypothetical protein